VFLALVFCVGRDFETGRYPVQGALLDVHKKTQQFREGKVKGSTGV